MPASLAVDAEALPRWRAVERAATALHRWHLLPADIAPRRHDEAHQHPCPTLVVPLAGAVRVRHRAGRIDLAPGDALLIAPLAIHEHDPLRGEAAYFHLGFIADFCDVAVHRGAGRIEGRIPVAQRRMMLDALALDGTATALAAVRALLASVLDDGIAPISWPHPAVPAMCHRLWAAFDRNLDGGTVLAASGMSRSQSAALFARAFGHGPAQELAVLRLAAAQHLLRAGHGVAATALRAGYGDRGRFTRAFRSAVGAAPSAWIGRRS